MITAESPHSDLNSSRARKWYLIHLCIPNFSLEPGIKMLSSAFWRWDWMDKEDWWSIKQLLITCAWEVHGAVWSLVTLQASPSFSSALLKYPLVLTPSEGYIPQAPLTLWPLVGLGRWEASVGERKVMESEVGVFLPFLPCLTVLFCASGTEDFNSCLGGPPKQLSVWVSPSLPLKTWDVDFLPLLVPDCLRIHLGSLWPAHTSSVEIL